MQTVVVIFIILLTIPLQVVNALSPEGYTIVLTDQTSSKETYVVQVSSLTITVYADVYANEQRRFGISLPDAVDLRSSVALVPDLEEMLKTTAGVDHEIATHLSWFVLQRIDAPEAAALYLKVIDSMGLESLVVRRDMPGIVWACHTDNDLVLDTVESLYPLARHTPLVPFQVLASTNAPRALELLQKRFDHAGESWGTIMAALLGGRSQIARSPWQYLSNEVLPRFALQLRNDDNGQHSLWVWSNLASYWTGDMIKGFARGHLGGHGQRYVHALLFNRDFRRIMMETGARRIRPEAEREAWSRYEALFEVCEAFGTRDQVEDLLWATKPFEKALFAPDAEAEWSHPRHSEICYNCTYQEVVESYRRSKESAVTAMGRRGTPSNEPLQPSPSEDILDH